MSAPSVLNVVSLRPGVMPAVRAGGDAPRSSAEALLFQAHRDAIRSARSARRCERVTQRQLDALHKREGGFARLARSLKGAQGTDAAHAEANAAAEAYAFLRRRCMACGKCTTDAL